MKEEKYELKIMSDVDLQKLDTKDYNSIDHIHIDQSKNKLDQTKINQIFDKMASTKLNRKFHLNLTKMNLDDSFVDRLLNCFSNWKDLTNLHLHFLNITIDDKVFEKLFCEGMTKLTNLKKVHLKLENSNINQNKLKVLENCTKSLPASTIKINLKNNNLTEKDIHNIRSIVSTSSANLFEWQ